MITGFERNKHLPPIDLCIYMLQVIAEEHGYGEVGDLDDYTKLRLKLGEFKYDPTFSRARHIWLKFKKLKLQPAAEIESVLIRQLASDDLSWEDHRPQNAPNCTDLAMNPPSGRLTKFEEYFSNVGGELKEAGRKVFKGDVYDEMARQENMVKMKSISGEAVRKRHERLKKEAKDHS